MQRNGCSITPNKATKDNPHSKFHIRPWPEAHPAEAHTPALPGERRHSAAAAIRSRTAVHQSNRMSVGWGENTAGAVGSDEAHTTDHRNRADSEEEDREEEPSSWFRRKE